MSSVVSEQPSRQLLDTNVLARYLLNDHPEHSPQARVLIESGLELQVCLVSLAELAFLLHRVVGVDRADVVDALVEVLERENIHVREVTNETTIRALLMCRPSGRVSFVDALLWATAREQTGTRIWTFDERFPPHDIQIANPREFSLA